MRTVLELALLGVVIYLSALLVILKLVKTLSGVTKKTKKEVLSLKKGKAKLSPNALWNLKQRLEAQDKRQEHKLNLGDKK